MADFDSEFFIDYSSLDDFQRQLIDRKNNKSMVVSGSAGSGKSLIALHKAKQMLLWMKVIRSLFILSHSENILRMA